MHLQLNTVFIKQRDMFKTVFVILISVLITGINGIDEDDVKYFLYTRQNPDEPIELNANLRKFTEFIDPRKSVKILCHGYTDTHKSYWIEPTKDAYITSGETNIISVDWSPHAFALYTHSFAKAKEIGEHIAKLAMTLSAGYKIPLSRFHLIGHSLGAHISGFAGKSIYKHTGQKIGRITGLDPAGPLFSENNADYRLTTEDAGFVDAIHTDTNVFGYRKPIAHADFWPNGGKSQKGCSLLSNCSHIRAPIYFYESVKNHNFPAWQCHSIREFNKGECFGNEKAVMGDQCDSNARGHFYLNTRSESPFGISSY